LGISRLAFGLGTAGNRGWAMIALRLAAHLPSGFIQWLCHRLNGCSDLAVQPLARANLARPGWRDDNTRP